MARRGNGEGSIYYSEKDGCWRGALVVGWKPDGKPKRKYFRGATRKEVVAKMQAAQQALAGGFLSTGTVPTVAEWLEHWLTVIAADRIRESTRAGYAGYLKRYLVPQLGRHRLDRLRAEHIEKAWADMSATGLAPATVRQAHRILSRALTIAVRRGHIVRNPATLLDGPSVVRAEVPFYTPAQARQLIAAAAADRLTSRWTVALALGLRQGEALGLCWDSIDLDAGTLTVRRALQRHTWKHGCAGACGEKRPARCSRRRGGGLVLVDPKSLRSRRTVVMPDELTAQLRARRTEQLEERLRAGSAWRGSGGLGDLVWTQADGTAIDPRADWAAWRGLVRRAGVPELRLHDARHTAASLLLAQGIAAKVVQAMLGHSSVQLTLDTYSHVAPELERGAAAAMSTALWS